MSTFRVAVLLYGVGMLIWMVWWKPSTRTPWPWLVLGFYILCVTSIRIYEPPSHDLVDLDYLLRVAGSQVYD